MSLVTFFQALRVFLEADGNLRSNPQWRCLKPKVLSPIKATNRLVRTLVGARKTAPTPSEVVQPAAVGRDIYRMLHENVQQIRGSFKHSPLSGEVGSRDCLLTNIACMVRLCTRIFGFCWRLSCYMSPNLWTAVSAHS